jgi:exopolysaccharide biosynthesis polyprenyl glycosylphosphotransferase
MEEEGRAISAVEHSLDYARELRARRARVGSRRGWLMRRMLVGADVTGLALAFICAELLYGSHGTPDRVALDNEIFLFVLTLPVWLLGGKLFGLYDRDEERADHSTTDELARVFLLITVGVFLVTRASLVVNTFDPDLLKLTAFWGFSIVFVAAGRVGARVLARKSRAYVQNTVIVGAGDVGQRVARKLLQHHEYGIDLVGFVDDRPKELRSHVEHVALLGGLDDLLGVVERYDVDRVIIAFSSEPHERFLPLIRLLRDSGVRVDLVPRLFDVMGPKIDVHTIEGMPLLGLPPVKLPRSSRALKRAVDLVGAGLMLLIFSPLLAAIAAAIRLESRGPVFFRQTRLGKDMREFSMLKFRTMRTGTDDAPHRAFIAATMDKDVPAPAGGLYKLSRDDAVTRVGRWLRKTSLDELPQLINVLRGDMSLVGPRPCIPYEIERFEPHHFERFLVPAGVTGLWQTSARAHSTFGEALDLDVLYAQSWSLGLDFVLLARTPLQLIRSGQTT